MNDDVKRQIAALKAEDARLRAEYIETYCDFVGNRLHELEAAEDARHARFEADDEAPAKPVVSAWDNHFARQAASPQPSTAFEIGLAHAIAKKRA